MSTWGRCCSFYIELEYTCGLNAYLKENMLIDRVQDRIRYMFDSNDTQSKPVALLGMPMSGLQPGATQL